MKLNLGSGAFNLDGYVNIDIYETFAPDIVWDLEKTPYPFADDNSVDEIRAHHSLEHMGHDPAVFLAIIQEFYRILKPGGVIDITVPPGHGERFSADPTHVRPIYPQTFLLFSKRQCKLWRESKFSNTPLADYIDVDFEIIHQEILLEEPWQQRFQSGELPQDDLNFALANYNGVYSQVRFIVQRL